MKRDEKKRRTHSCNNIDFTESVKMLIGGILPILKKNLYIEVKD